MNQPPRYALALDLATHCGWAIGDETHLVASGTVDLSYNAKYSNPGARLTKFINFLNDINSQYPLKYIAYEEVKQGGGGSFHSSAKANKLYFNLQGLLEWYADQLRIYPRPYHVMTIKKQFAGSGRSDKEAMAKEAVSRGWTGAVYDPQGMVLNHDEVDAVAILCVHMQEMGHPFSIVLPRAPVPSDLLLSEEEMF